jgi:hypothetical protein
MGVYPTCTLPVIAYNAPIYPQPVVTLSAVPYTGLDLGTAGTAIYWAFLAAWTALAAYLLIVKKIQNSLANKLNSFLFGSI